MRYHEKLKLDYCGRVIDGGSILIDAVSKVFEWLIIILLYVFGWPLALLSWVKEH